MVAALQPFLGLPIVAGVPDAHAAPAGPSRAAEQTAGQKEDAPLEEAAQLKGFLEAHQGQGGVFVLGAAALRELTRCPERALPPGCVDALLGLEESLRGGCSMGCCGVLDGCMNGEGRGLRGVADRCKWVAVGFLRNVWKRLGKGFKWSVRDGSRSRG